MTASKIDEKFFLLVNDLLSGENTTRNQAEDQLKNVDYGSIFSNASALLMAEKNHNNETMKDGLKVVTCTLIKNRFPRIDHDNKNQDGTVNFSKDVQTHITNLFQLYSMIGKAPTERLATKFVLGNLLVDPIVSVLSVSNSQLFQQFVSSMLTLIQQSNSENESLIAVGALSKFSDQFKSNNIPDKSVIDVIAQYASRVMQQIHDLNSITADMEDFSLELIKHLAYFISFSEVKKSDEIRPLADLLVNFSCFILSLQNMIQHWGSVTDHLMQVAGFKPRMFSPHLQLITDAIISVLVVKMPIAGVKSSAIRLHSRLFEFMKKTFLQMPEKFKKFVMLLADLMDDPDDLDIFDDDEDEMEEYVQNSVSRQAEIAFDKMCCEEPDLMFGFVKEAVAKLFAPEASISQNVAGINIVSCAGEGCRKHYEKHIKEIIGSYILPMVHSKKHPKIRYTALTALGVVCSEFKSVIVDKLLNEILEAYKVALLDSSNDAVYRHAFLALNNFFEVCPEFLLTKVVRELIPCFSNGLQNKSQKIVSQVISSIFQLAERDFRMDEFYTAIRQHLIKIIEITSNSPETFDQTCMSLLTLCQVGSHVEKSMFAQDAQHCLNLIFSYLDKLLKDNYFKYDMKSLVSSLVVIADVMKQDFSPFVDQSLNLSLVLFQTLIESTKNQSPLSEEEVLKMLQNNSVENDKFKSQTTLTETCSAACELVSTICNSMKQSVYPKMNQFLGFLTEFINMPNMLIQGFNTLSSILAISDSNIDENWSNYLEVVKTVYNYAKDAPELYNEFISIIMETVEKLGENYLRQEFLTIMDEVIKHGIKSQQDSSIKSFQFKNFKNNEEIVDDENLDEYMYDDDDEESSYLEGVSSYVGTMFKISKNKFASVFESFIPELWKFVETPNLEEGDAFCILSVWSSLLENAPQETVVHFKEPLQILINKFIQYQEWPLVERVVFFMINLISKTKANQFDELIQKNIPAMIEYVKTYEDTVDDNTQLAIDNAVSAIISILRHLPYILDSHYNATVLYVLQKLPLRSDLEEIPNAYEFVCELIESSAYSKLDENSLKYLILSIVQGCEIVEMHLEKSQLLNRLVNSIKMMKNNCPSFSTITSTLSENNKNTLHLLTK